MHEASALSVDPQFELELKLEALLPLIVMLPIISGPLPGLVSVSFCIAVLLIVVGGKVSEFVLNVAMGLVQ